MKMTADRIEHSYPATETQILEKRAESLACEVVEEDTAADLASMLLFRIGEEWYAVRLADVREVFQDYTVTPIPCALDFIRGVVNVRGHVVSVTDPAAMMSLGRVGRCAGAQPPAIVVKSGGVETALVVDEIGVIADIADGSIEPPLSTIGRAQAGFVVGSICVNGSMVGLLNIERVLEPIGASSRH